MPPNIELTHHRLICHVRSSSNFPPSTISLNRPPPGLLFSINRGRGSGKGSSLLTLGSYETETCKLPPTHSTLRKIPLSYKSFISCFRIPPIISLVLMITVPMVVLGRPRFQSSTSIFSRVVAAVAASRPSSTLCSNSASSTGNRMTPSSSKPRHVDPVLR